MDDAYAQAYKLAGEGTYELGAWTAARCKFWNLMETEELKMRFYNWVEKEKKQGFFHPFELPKPPSRSLAMRKINHFNPMHRSVT